MRKNYWVRIRKSRVADVSGLPWLIKLYAPDALYYFDYEESTRTATFEQALEVAAYFLGCTGKKNND